MDCDNCFQSFCRCHKQEFQLWRADINSELNLCSTACLQEYAHRITRQRTEQLVVLPPRETP